MTSHRVLGALALAGLGAAALTGCVANSGSDAAQTITVTSTGDSCDVSPATALSGTVAFDVRNAGDDVTEFYLLAADGVRVVGEVEDLVPGASRTLTVAVEAGDYVTLCKPGMTGDGVGRAAFSVSD